LVDEITCEICEAPLQYDSVKTLESFATVMDLSPVNISDKIDDIIGQFLVYRCPHCGVEYRYTYKDLERKIRKDVTEKLYYALAREEFLRGASDPVLIYCGKCQGFDGKGSCPRAVYKDCKIKRFPNVI
jgi:hypothetical protein